MVEVKVPGKLYIAGEYAVVSPGHKSLLISVNKFITVRVKKSNKKGSIKSYSNIKMIWSRIGDELIIEQEDDRFEYIFSAMQIVEKYIKELNIEPQFYDIEVLSDLETEDGIKYGLGSSAAIVVAIVKSLLQFYGVEYSKLDLFKLSVLASVRINVNGSSGDIASAVFNGFIIYRSFSRKDIKNRLQNERISSIIKSEWEGLDIKSIPINKDIKFLIGWTKSPASSQVLVRNSKSHIKNHLDFYNKFLIESNKCVEDIMNSYINNNFEKLKNAVEKNRQLLNDYARKLNIIIENDSLKRLVDLSKEKGFASKSSGAGGGDCGIAIYDSKFDTKELEEKWEANNILKLDLDIYLGD